MTSSLLIMISQVKTRILLPCLAVLACGQLLSAAEYFVAPTGRDSDSGTRKAPLRTIQRAADLAQPGDVITVRAGVYRERINPPRGGTSDRKRIIYQGAPGERVEIKGSEVVKDWQKVQSEVWKVTLPNSFFGISILSTIFCMGTGLTQKAASIIRARCISVAIGSMKRPA